MPFKPNYSFERRQRELAKAEKKAARLEARARKPERQAAENRSGESDGQADESPPKAEGGAMSDTDMNCGIATCGVASSPDRALVTLYPGSTEVRKSFEFTLPKDLAQHLAT